MPERCVCCGEIIPEGRQYCSRCAGFGGADAVLSDGTLLYLKTSNIPGGLPEQLELYRKLGIMKED